MSEDAVTVEHLSKSYLIGHRHTLDKTFKYNALRDVIGQEVRNFARKATDVLRGRQIVQGDVVEEFHALDDVNFSVKQGEVFGIIGRNGAGKSTLLKILSRITEPTKGRLILRGRVSSLLEVGTGFHPELTGRENIFLNGAVLGMTRREIVRKFDQIVDFAEVEKFLDTPVKHYSSGMYVRLAFAVAAHLEPEILIVDEVLAVGDSEFQKKCLGKMDEVSRTQGRTVLFVSHNMEAVLKLCNRTLLIEAGRVRDVGNTDAVVASYMNSRSLSSKVVDLMSHKLPTDFTRKVRPLTVAPSDAMGGWTIGFGTPISLDISIDVESAVKQVELAIGICTTGGSEVVTWTTYCDERHLQVDPGINTFRIEFESLSLLPGRYSLVITFGAGRGFEATVYDAASFEINSNAAAAAINADGMAGAVVTFAKVSRVA